MARQDQSQSESMLPANLRKIPGPVRRVRGHIHDHIKEETFPDSVRIASLLEIIQLSPEIQL